MVAGLDKVQCQPSHKNKKNKNFVQYSVAILEKKQWSIDATEVRGITSIFLNKCYYVSKVYSSYKNIVFSSHCCFFHQFIVITKKESNLPIFAFLIFFSLWLQNILVFLPFLFLLLNFTFQGLFLPSIHFP